MRNLLIALVLSATAAAHAQSFTVPSCIPKTFWTPFGTGTNWVLGRAQPVDPGPVTSYRGWWCPTPQGAWLPYAHLSVERTDWPLNQIDTELSTVFRSSDRVNALGALINRYSIPPTETEKPSWDAAAVKVFADLAVIKPSVTPIGVWITPSAGSIFTFANGKLTGLTGRKATKGAACDCVKAKALVGASTYCALAAGPATEVTACVQP